MYGVSFFSAVINPPQACILAVGSGVSRVVPPAADSKDGNPRVVNTVQVQLSGDRRVVDEATAAQFLQVFQKYLSDANTMIM
jgi:pyruvate dehydrogenase E2 component (dihydrolipoamide acetyltransferase)